MKNRIVESSFSTIQRANKIIFNLVFLYVNINPATAYRTCNILPLLHQFYLQLFCLFGIFITGIGRFV